ncbi:MAG: hypothetical protein RL215_1886, partial [Planctomycetota bacterium]
MFQGLLRPITVAGTLLASGFLNLAAAQSDSAATTRSAQILPKDTYVHISVPSMTEMKNQMAKSSLGRMVTDPEMDAFRAGLMTAFAAEMQGRSEVIEAALGMTLADLASIPTGEIAIAFSKAPPNRMGAVLFMDFGSNEDKIRSLLDKAVAALQNAPDLEQANSEHAGTELVMFKNNGPSAKSTPLAKEFGWFLKDQKMVFSNSSAVLKLMLDNWDGSSPKSLVNSENYSNFLSKCETKPGSGLSVTWVDPIGLFTQLVQTGSLGEAGLQAGMAVSIFGTIGLNQLKGFGSVSEMNTGGFESLTQSIMVCEQPPQFLMQMFQLDTTDTAPPSWVKENVSSWMSTKWKVDEAWNTAESMVDMFQGAGALQRMVDDLADRDPNVHIKNDVIDLLDGSIQLVTSGASDNLIAIGVKDNSKAAELLGKLAAQPGFPAEQRDLEGNTVYQLPLGPGSNVAFTVANNLLLVGIGESSLLEMAIRNTSDVRPLSETPAFQAVAAHFPADAKMVSYSSSSDQIKSLYEMLRSGNIADSLPGAGEILAAVDFTSLPP